MLHEKKMLLVYQELFLKFGKCWGFFPRKQPLTGRVVFITQQDFSRSPKKNVGDIWNKNYCSDKEDDIENEEEDYDENHEEDYDENYEEDYDEKYEEDVDDNDNNDDYDKEEDDDDDNNSE